MGQISTKLVLANGIDDALARQGKIDVANVRHIELTALVDPQRTFSSIPVSVMIELGLQLRAKKLVADDGEEDVMNSTAPILFTISGRDTFDEALIDGRQAVVGQTVLAKLQLCVDEGRGELKVSDNPLRLSLRH